MPGRWPRPDGSPKAMSGWSSQPGWTTPQSRQVFAPLMPLLPSEARPILKRSGMYALSAPGALDEVLATAGMTLRSDETIGATAVFADAAAAVEAFLSAGA